MSGFDKGILLLACLAPVVPALAADHPGNSELEISGRVAVGMDYIDNIDHSARGDGSHEKLFRGSGNNWGTSMLTIKGDQQLGEFGAAGDVKALFMLESGFDANQGKLNGDGTLFNRYAWAGLESSRLGKLMIGRIRWLSNNVWYIDPFYEQFIAAPTLVRGRSWQDTKDIIAYTTPTWNGWTGELQFGAGGKAGSFNSGRKEAASLNYTRKAPIFYTIYDQWRDGDGHYSSLFKYSRELITGAAWHLDGHWDLYAGYNHLQAGDAVPVEQGGDDGYSQADHYWVGAHWWVTPRWMLQAAVYRIDVNDGPQATLPVFGTTYNLSDDFFVYATYGRVLNGDGADFAVEASDERPAPGQNQNAFYFGFVYSFKAGPFKGTSNNPVSMTSAGPSLNRRVLRKCITHVAHRSDRNERPHRARRPPPGGRLLMQAVRHGAAVAPSASCYARSPSVRSPPSLVRARSSGCPCHPSAPTARTGVRRTRVAWRCAGCAAAAPR